MLQIIKTTSIETRNESSSNTRGSGDDDKFLSFGEILILCIFVLISISLSNISSHLKPVPLINQKIINQNNNGFENEQIVMNSHWITENPVLLNFQQKTFSWCGKYEIYDKSKSNQDAPLLFYATGTCLSLHDKYNLYLASNNKLLGTFTRYPQFFSYDQCTFSVNNQIIATLQRKSQFSWSTYYYNIYKGYSTNTQDIVYNMSFSNYFGLSMKIENIYTHKLIGNASRGYEWQWTYNYDFNVSSGGDLSFLSLVNVAIDVTNDALSYHAYLDNKKIVYISSIISLLLFL